MCQDIVLLITETLVIIRFLIASQKTSTGCGHMWNRLQIVLQLIRPQFPSFQSNLDSILHPGCLTLTNYCPGPYRLENRRHQGKFIVELHRIDFTTHLINRFSAKKWEVKVYFGMEAWMNLYLAGVGVGSSKWSQFWGSGLGWHILGSLTKDLQKVYLDDFGGLLLGKWTQQQKKTYPPAAKRTPDCTSTCRCHHSPFGLSHLSPCRIDSWGKTAHKVGPEPIVINGVVTL